jgi:tetratricopeptide (TPR) repeat protein
MVYSLAMTFFKRDKKMDNHFENKDGEQNIGQGPNAIGKQVNNYNVQPEVFAKYAEELGVTKAALTSFFKILEQEKVPLGDLDSKLREIAFQHKELLLRFESVQSDDSEVRNLKVEAKNAIENGRFAEAEDWLVQARERDRQAVARMKDAIAEQQAALEKRQLSEAASCKDQAILQRLQYHHVKAAEFFKEAAMALPEGRKEERAAYLGAAGSDLERISSYRDALHLYKQSLSVCREVGNRKEEGKLLNNITAIYQVQGEYGKASEQLEKILLICRETGEKDLEGAALNNLSQLYKATGEYAKAMRCLKQSLRLLQRSGHKEGECVTLNNIGGIFHTLGDHVAALRYYEQILTISREIKDRRVESLSLNNISQLHSAQGNNDEALRYLEQSLAITRQIGERRGEWTILNNIGRTYECQGDYPAALKHYKQSLVILREIGHKDGLAAISWNIGLLYMKKSELAKAQPYISRAVELGTQLEHPKLAEWRTALEEVRAKLREQRN